MEAHWNLQKVRDNDKAWEELLQDAEMHADQIQQDVYKLEDHKSANDSVWKAMKEYSESVDT